LANTLKQKRKNRAWRSLGDSNPCFRRERASSYVIVPAALAPESPRSHVWHARASVHRGRAAPHSCGPMLRIEGSSTISPQRRRGPISAGGRLGNAWNNTPDCCGWGGTPCRRCIPYLRSTVAFGGAVLRLRFPVVVFPAHGRWRWPGARRNDRSYGAVDRAASHPRPRHPAQSVRLGLDCADAAGAREAYRLFRTFDIPTMRS